MTDSISFITLTAIIAIGLIIWFYNRKQASALKSMARALEDTHMIAVKNRQDEHRRTPFTTSPLDWVADQADSGSKPIDIIGVSQKPMWANLRCNDGARIVVSPLSHPELKAVLANHSKSKLASVEEPLLGVSRKAVTAVERSLRNNEWFDLEADAVGKKFGVNWGETPRLYFYTVASKG